MIRRYEKKPLTPGTRHQVVLRWTGENGVQEVPKSLSWGIKQSGGRNNRGRITSFHRGGGVKRLYRVLNHQDWQRGKVRGIQYDPNRTARIALLETHRIDNGKAVQTANPYTYILAEQQMQVGQMVYKNQRDQGAVEGNILRRKEIPEGYSVYNVERTPGHGGKRIRSAGTTGVILRGGTEEVRLRRPSGEMRKINAECQATVGRVNGEDHKLEVIGKAGRNRHLGIRPKVRGVAKNPVDHPHGGRTKGGRPDVTPWAWPTKGQPTRNPRKKSNYIVKHL